MERRYMLVRSFKVLGSGSEGAMFSEARILNRTVGFGQPKYHVLIDDGIGLGAIIRKEEKTS